MLLKDMINMQSVITFNAVAKFLRSCKLFFFSKAIFGIFTIYEYMSRYLWTSTGYMTRDAIPIHS